jgi:hypothetical protein
MSNYELAVDWGVKMAYCCKPNGKILLGLIGSDFSEPEISKVFKDINSIIPVRYVDSEAGVYLLMEKI